MGKSFNILHVANDEKFINTAYSLFEEAFPGANKVTIVKPPADPPLRYIKTVSGMETVVVGQGAIEKLIEQANRSDFVVLHGIDKVKGTLLLSSENREKFAGIIFGGELYNESVTGDDYLGGKTREIKEKISKRRFYDLLKSVYRTIFYRDSRNEITDAGLEEIFGNLYVYGTHFPESLDKWICKEFIPPTAESFHFSYFPIDHIVCDETLRCTGKNIFLGNSASLTNNHFEILEKLKNIGISNRQIIAPLSYGDPRYANEIKNAGTSMFGRQFKAVNSYMALEDYNRMISDCEIVIMNHYRSQALGTTLASLYLGAKVFLNDTEVYRYLTSVGCNVYLIDESLEEELIGNEPLPKSVVARNRSILRSRFSSKVLVSSIRSFFKDRFNSSIAETYY
jgi:hypothetical protein